MWMTYFEFLGILVREKSDFGEDKADFQLETKWNQNNSEVVVMKHSIMCSSNFSFQSHAFVLKKVP